MMKTDFANFVELRDEWIGRMRRRKKKRYHDKLFHGALHLQAVHDGANHPEETIKDKETFRALWPFDSDV